MKQNAGAKLAKNSRRIAIAIVAGGVMAAAVHASPSNNVILVPPADLPALARESGEAMLLRKTIDGRTLLYIEQNQGSRLASFDVTDPVHVKSAGSVQLESSGPFDFLSPVGKQAELIRFRQGQEKAVLDLHKGKVLNLKTVQWPTLQGPVARLGDDAFTVAGQETDMQSDQEYEVVETTDPLDLGRVLDVKQVREKVTNEATGTTFLLTQNGLYVIRRPAVEWNKRERDQEWFYHHAGG